MKIDRQIGILSALLQEENLTAPELAERFEVSRRTINRDIEDLCKAGIPIQTVQGAGGGISIMEGYAMDRTLLSSKDMKMIMAGLRSLDSVSGSHYYSQLMEKLKPGSSHLITGSDSILIDLSSGNKEKIAGQIALLQDAIESRQLVSFDYYAPAGDSHRMIEPCYLLFKWTSWYIYGFCRDRHDFRMFKLGRMMNLRREDEGFVLRQVPAPEATINEIFPPRIEVEALVSPQMKWRLIEQYGMDCCTEQSDGRLLFKGIYSDMEHLLSEVLSFGDQMEIIRPDSVRQELRQMAEKLTGLYGKS